MGLVFKYGSEKERHPAACTPRSGEGLEFWITNKIREIRDKADDIKHRIGVITGKDELKLSDQNLVPKQGRQGGRRACRASSSRPSPSTRSRSQPEDGEADRQGLRRAHHHAAAQGLHRQGAPPHRRVPDARRQVARRATRRRSRSRRNDADDERDAQHARSRQAARRLRHRDEEGRRLRLRRAVPHRAS